ncbi:hypothetical protein SAMN05444141_103421 [Pseudovibrio denitrificans]|uniref:Uncharacterized protein n=1 Tax=Pseudovibrio denitrificans TaxID=258256 RepID=A0A1I7AW98_9HYPH|nr:hypothetical protein SAMN05444141_103421 [Pseudovibrio denitrificans]
MRNWGKLHVGIKLFASRPIDLNYVNALIYNNKI